PIFAHLKYNNYINFKGDVELLAERDYFDLDKDKKENNKQGTIITKLEYYLSPGSLLKFEKSEIKKGYMSCDGKIHLTG
ncbi:MAG: hypothetical protein J7K72_00045, partial [Candidatus Aenigmarchaeota archaeon]|nr:hypothetical protein [Candidatus Aenigmarchaeota archaeon]